MCLTNPRLAKRSTSAWRWKAFYEDHITGTLVGIYYGTFDRKARPYWVKATKGYFANLHDYVVGYHTFRTRQQVVATFGNPGYHLVIKRVRVRGRAWIGDHGEEAWPEMRVPSRSRPSERKRR